MNSDCPFCRIVAGEEDADIVAESDSFVCFHDIYPVNEGHALVIPKEHVQHLESYDGDTGALFRFLEECHEKIRRKYDPDATNIEVNNGRAAGQTVPHLHWHIIPRYDGDMKNPEGGVRGVIPDERTY